MDSGAIRALLIDDDRDDYDLTRDLLADIPGNRIALDWVSDFEIALAELVRGAHDVYLLDYSLGLRTGLELLRESLRRGSKALVIILTGQNDRNLALEALDAGAADYLVKGTIDALTLERSIRYALQQKRHGDDLERKVQERTAELERANGALRAGEEALQEASRRKDDFLAMLAHELRNPLAPIRNAAEVLRMLGGDDPRLRAAKDIIERQVRHMTRLIDDLLDLSRITRGKIELRIEPLPVRAVVDAAVEACRPDIESHGHTLAVNALDEVWVEGDQARLIQVIANLLINAAKFTARGGHISLSAARHPGAVVISVRDTGIGISKAAQGRIFDLFVQEDASLARSQGGLGIGLTLVKQLVDVHGGSVAVKSEGLGKGSEFLVTLPIFDRGEPAEARPLPSSDRDKTSARLAILVVEDNEDAAESFRMVLELRGHEVRVARDGVEALRCFEVLCPDVAFVDLGLPGIDGFVLAERVRARGGKRPTLVALSGYGGAGDKQRAKEAGFDQHMTKPVDHERVQALLTRLGSVAPSPERTLRDSLAS